MRSASILINEKEANVPENHYQDLDMIDISKYILENITETAKLFFQNAGTLNEDMKNPPSIVFNFRNYDIESLFLIVRVEKTLEKLSYRKMADMYGKPFSQKVDPNIYLDDRNAQNIF
ncbi:hypothetical protein RF11_10268 [Thelohanellus kitauei]|uniref:Uncharacterized protein n=1 Tax=Thelohanellus kitauei TaxID=669202 RepID=A0A0C2J2X7_THEKT|nr:hypothetical protein RF11_10268 [Thelohanellus kitauei]